MARFDHVPAKAKALPLAKARRAAERATSDLADSLEALATSAALSLSRRNPAKRVVFVSAMGTWFWHVGDGLHCERRPAADAAFSNALQSYGWDAIPASVHIECLGGQVVKRMTDW